MTAQTVRDLVEINDSMGTISGEKADLVWEEACDNLNETVVDSSARLPVSESYIREALKEIPPEAFGI